MKPLQPRSKSTKITSYQTIRYIAVRLTFNCRPLPTEQIMRMTCHQPRTKNKQRSNSYKKMTKNKLSLTSITTTDQLDKILCCNWISKRTPPFTPLHSQAFFCPFSLSFKLNPMPFLSLRIFSSNALDLNCHFPVQNSGNVLEHAVQNSGNVLGKKGFLLVLLGYPNYEFTWQVTRFHRSIASPNFTFYRSS